jgi:putative Mg2+ transporter-C (MgtC) family protein
MAVSGLVEPMDLGLATFGLISITPKLLTAFLLGALIGLERQFRQRHTGLATHALVALGAAIYTSLPGLLNMEPDVRMGGQVVTGIGFLGAGLIMRDGMNVRGLSTAATVWATGAVGVFAGYGFILEAVEAAFLIIVINMALPRLSWLVDAISPENDEVERYYIVELRCSASEEAMVRTKLLQAMNVRKLRLHSLESHAIEESSSVQVKAVVFSAREQDELVETLVGELSLTPSVFSTSWTSTAPPE